MLAWILVFSRQTLKDAPYVPTVPAGRCSRVLAHLWTGLPRHGLTLVQ